MSNLHTNQSRSYLNHLVHHHISALNVVGVASISNFSLVMLVVVAY
jgi:hypothetical protein